MSDFITSTYDAQKVARSLTQTINALDALLVRVERGRITLPGVARELTRVLRGPLAKARRHGAFTEP